jgi:drug/metabolite transporter (DMT)-like permease
MGLELTIIFAFVSMLGWGFTDFFVHRSVRKVGDMETLAFIVVIGTIAFFPFIVGELPLLFQPQNLSLLVVLGVVAFAASLINFEALRTGKLSIVDVIFEIELPVTIILGFVFFSETLSPLQFFLVACILLGIVLIATKSFRHWRTSIEKGVVLAFLAAILMGVTNFLMAASSRQVSPLIAVWSSWLIVAVLCVIYMWRKRTLHLFGRNFMRYKWLMLAMTFADLVAWVLYSVSLYNNEVSVITAITEAYPAVALFLGMSLNGERSKAHQQAGAVIALLACALLGFAI